MSLGNSIRSGTSWLITASAGMQIISFAIGVILARILAPEDFGAIVTIQIFTGIAGFVAAGGTGEALIQAKNVSERDYQVVFTIQFLVGILLFSLMYLLAYWVGDWFNNPLYTALMHVSVLTFLWRPFANIPTVRLRRDMRFKPLAIIRLVTLIFGSAVSITLAFLDMGPWSLVFSGIASSLFNIMILNLLIRRPFKIQFHTATARRLSSFGFRFFTVDTLDYVINQTGNFIIGRNTDAASVGLFNKADSMRMIPVTAIGGSVYQPVFRALAEQQDNDDTSWYLYRRTISLLSVYMLPFHVFLFWLSAPLIEFIYGTKWIAAAEPMQILAITGLFLCFGQPSGALIAARNQLQKEMLVQASACILLFIAASIGIKNFSLIGVAFAIVAVEAYRSTGLVFIASKILNIKMSKIFASMRTGMALNGILFLALLITDLALADNLSNSSPASYLFIMSAIGSSCYLMAFFYLPFADLESESQRWKKKIALLVRKSRAQQE